MNRRTALTVLAGASFAGAAAIFSCSAPDQPPGPKIHTPGKCRVCGKEAKTALWVDEDGWRVMWWFCEEHRWPTPKEALP